MSMTRRSLLAAGAASLLGSAAAMRAALAQDDYGTFAGQVLVPPQKAPEPPPIDYPIERVDLRIIPAGFRRQVVSYDGEQWPGTIIIDTGNCHLYKILSGGQAIRYGVGVGREGFGWSGLADVGAKRIWPEWNPPKEMVARDVNAAKWADGQPGGPDNPLGARALYLFQDGRDTLYRIHGTNAPKTIGKAMSSGCIRMLNQDVAELYDATPIGARVIVLPSSV